MFEKELEEKLKAIFKLKKVSYSQPSNAKEQETLFIEIENAKNSIKDGRVVSMITGHAVVFGNSDKLPFGYFSKCIKQADPSLTKELFFFDIENNSRIYQNIVERSFGFIYFFSGQYDPDIGSITSVLIMEE